MTRLLAVSLVCLFAACGTPQPGAKPETGPRDAKDGKEPTTLFTTMTEALAETREIARAYAEGKLGDQLVAGELVLIDAKAPKGTDQAQYYLLPADFSGPMSTATDLQTAARADRGRVKRALVSGEDGDQVGLVRKIVAGKYIACAVLGPMSPPNKDAYLKRSRELVGAGKADSKKLLAAARQAQEETGYKPQKFEWSTVPASCKPVEVTGDAASRVVVIEGVTPAPVPGAEAGAPAAGPAGAPAAGPAGAPAKAPAGAPAPAPAAK